MLVMNFRRDEDDNDEGKMEKVVYPAMQGNCVTFAQGQKKSY